MTQNIERFFANVSSSPLSDAYQRRSPVIPWMADTAVPKEEISQTWKEICELPRSGKGVAYVHVPFCSNHCLFCNFYKNATSKNTSGPYVDALIQEIEREAETIMVQSAPIHAIFMGGGTPTDLDAEDLYRVIKTMRRCLPLAADCEYTVEGRATGFSKEKIMACLEAGANRFSFGVQTFDTVVRKQLGRKMDGDKLIEFLDDICSLDRATIVCDLIYGLPNQDEARWRHDIELCEQLGIDGVDLYALTLFPSSPLALAIKRGALPAGVKVTEQGAYYATGIAMLEEAGWRQLTNAHFARQTRERNLYNQLVKSGADCLAYGAGAGGSSTGYSYKVASDIKGYHERNAAGEKPLGGVFKMGWGHEGKTLVTDGIEVGRLDPVRVEKSGATNFCKALEPLAVQWEAAGLVNVRNGVLWLTVAGRFWNTNLTSSLHHLIDAIGPNASKLKAPVDIKNFSSKPPAHILQQLSQQPTTQKPPIPMSATDAIEHDKETRKELLRKKFAEDASGIIEHIAKQNGLTTKEAVCCLPKENLVQVEGSEFTNIMEELSEWGPILMIVHTEDAIIECSGSIPKGRFGRGFYNLEKENSITGHIKADRCTDIFLMRRPFMKLQTVSVQFFNADGNSMYKVFVSRDEQRNLNPEQVKKFDALWEKYEKKAVATA